MRTSDTQSTYTSDDVEVCLCVMVEVVMYMRGLGFSDHINGKTLCVYARVYVVAVPMVCSC